MCGAFPPENYITEANGEYIPVHPLSMDSRNDNTHPLLQALIARKRSMDAKRRGPDSAMHDMALLSKKSHVMDSRLVSMSTSVESILLHI